MCTRHQPCLRGSTEGTPTSSSSGVCDGTLMSSKNQYGPMRLPIWHMTSQLVHNNCHADMQARSQRLWQPASTSTPVVLIIFNGTPISSSKHPMDAGPVKPSHTLHTRQTLSSVIRTLSHTLPFPPLIPLCSAVLASRCVHCPAPPLPAARQPCQPPHMLSSCTTLLRTRLTAAFISSLLSVVDTCSCCTWRP